MTIEDIKSVINDYIPEILSIGFYEDRLNKCVKILKDVCLKNTFSYTQDFKDVIDMLETFLIENEAYGYMKEHNYSAFEEAIRIVDICKTCLFENKYWREVPLMNTCYADYGNKMCFMGITIGCSKHEAITAIEKYDLLYEIQSEGKVLNLQNKLVSNNIEFNLKLCIENEKVYGILLTPAYNSNKWLVLAVIDDFFAKCHYKLKQCSTDSIIQLYDSYYDIAEVNNLNVKIVSAKTYKEQHKSWWKF